MTKKIITSKKPAPEPAKRVVFPAKGSARVIIDTPPALDHA